MSIFTHLFIIFRQPHPNPYLSKRQQAVLLHPALQVLQTGFQVKNVLHRRHGKAFFPRTKQILQAVHSQLPAHRSHLVRQSRQTRRILFLDHNLQILKLIENRIEEFPQEFRHLLRLIS